DKKKTTKIGFQETEKKRGEQVEKVKVRVARKFKDKKVEKGTSCQSCEERKERYICSACRQTEPQEDKTLEFYPSLMKKKYLYRGATIIRDKLPVQFRTEFDQLLPQLKLNANEQELITKAEKFLADFLAEKGGKQDHID
ncbi:7575_t:CDS:2, partial [Ambispora leptoticha]